LWGLKFSLYEGILCKSINDALSLKWEMSYHGVHYIVASYGKFEESKVLDPSFEAEQHNT